MLVEVLLQLFVGVVNAELLKRVVLENLEPEYVQHSNEITLEGHIVQWNHVSSALVVELGNDYSSCGFFSMRFISHNCIMYHIHVVTNFRGF